LNVVIAIAQEFSPRYERHRDDLVSVDISGLTRLLGSAQAIGEELRREAAARGVRAHVAVARTRMAALLIAQGRPGLTVIAPGEEPAALAPLSLALLEKSEVGGQKSEEDVLRTSDFVLRISRRWGLKTLGEVASLPTADLVSRLGRGAAAWQAIARGEDIRPLVPMLEDERFEASLDRLNKKLVKVGPKRGASVLPFDEVAALIAKHVSNRAQATKLLEILRRIST
jgi:hypothetical protein